MTVQGVLTSHRVLSHLMASHLDTFLCLSSWSQTPISKRALRKLALADRTHAVPSSPQTYSDHLRKLMELGLLAEDVADAQVVVLTPLGHEVRRALIESMRRAVRADADLQLIRTSNVRHTG